MPKTLLLADDSVTIQKVVGISFASEDIAITTVDNGNDAVAKARELRPDVILADVVMPGLSGYEVCEAVKADPALRHVPVLLLTGTFEAFDEERAAAAGAAGHVAKPFEAQTLVERVRQLLAAAPAPQAAPAPPAPAPAGTSEAADDTAPDAYEFFSDEEPAAARSDDFSTGPLDLEGPDAAFAFGEEELSEATREPLPPAGPSAPPAPDATVAILPEPAAADGGFDVSFEDAPASAPERAPERPDPLGHTALLDPAAGRDLDVSSSDLAVDLSSGPEGALYDEGSDLTEPEPLESAPFPADPVLEALSAPPPADPPRPFGAEPDPGDTLPGSESPAATPAVAAEPLADAELEAEPLEAEPWEAEPVADALVDAEPEAPAAGFASDALTPAMREELRDTLEKIAWDAFGQVTEKVVREAIERVERAAWEVVPKLAETLIQEEIRRLKGGGD